MATEVSSRTSVVWSQADSQVHIWACPFVTNGAPSSPISQRADAGTHRERVPGERVETFDPVGHAPGADAGDLVHRVQPGQLTDALTLGEVVVVSLRVAFGQGVVVLQPL